MHRIQRISKIMVFALTIAIGMTIILGGYLVFNSDQMFKHFSDPNILLPDIPPLLTWQIAGLAGLALLNFLPVIYVFWQFRRLFQCFTGNNIFTKTATRHIFNAAKGLFAIVLIGILNTTAAILILTAKAAEGEHMLALNVSLTEVLLIFTGAIFLVMGWTMQEAARIAQENAEFV